MYSSSVANRLRVEVKHRRPVPNRYTWEIHSEDKVLPVKESHDEFSSWEEASQAGKKALKKFLTMIAEPFSREACFLNVYSALGLVATEFGGKAGDRPGPATLREMSNVHRTGSR